MDFKASAVLQARSITALLRRRVRSEFSGTRGGYAWAILEPIAVVFFLRFVIRPEGGLPPLGDSIEVFLATGFILARTWRQTSTQLATALGRENMWLLPSIMRMDLVIAILVLEFFTALIVMTFILAILSLFGFDTIPANPIKCALAFVTTMLLALVMGLIISILEVLAPEVRPARHIFVLPFFVLSGFAFLVDRMPLGLAKYLVWNPVLHCLEMFREGFYQSYECRLLDLVYLFTVIAVGLCIGLAGERAFRKKHRKQVFYTEASDQAL